MAGAIVIRNLSDVMAGYKATQKKLEFAAKYAIGIAGLELERQAKINANGPAHTKGTPRISGFPGPNTVTGNLKRSIFSRTRIGFGSYIAEVGASMEYARQVELGGGNWPNGVKYPFITPAAEKLSNSGKLSRTFTMAFASKLKG
tara:strand:- start:3035 stop:3469 length:435 start_codon:yes stop_codon:yes gene_type:complete